MHASRKKKSCSKILSYLCRCKYINHKQNCTYTGNFTLSSLTSHLPIVIHHCKILLKIFISFENKWQEQAIHQKTHFRHVLSFARSHCQLQDNDGWFLTPMRFKKNVLTVVRKIQTHTKNTNVRQRTQSPKKMR